MLSPSLRPKWQTVSRAGDLCSQTAVKMDISDDSQPNERFSKRAFVVCRAFMAARALLRIARVRNRSCSWHKPRPKNRRRARTIEKKRHHRLRSRSSVQRRRHSRNRSGRHLRRSVGSHVERRHRSASRHSLIVPRQRRQSARRRPSVQHVRPCRRPLRLRNERHRPPIHRRHPNVMRRLRQRDRLRLPMEMQFQAGRQIRDVRLAVMANARNRLRRRFRPL